MVTERVADAVSVMRAVLRSAVTDEDQ